MMLLLIQFLHEQFGWHIPQAFSYTSTRMMLAVITALLLSIWLGPWFIRQLYALKIGQPIRTEDFGLVAKLHEKKKNTPTMGGLLILFSMVAALLLWMNLKSPFTLILLFTTLALGAVGGYDDYLKLKGSSHRGLSRKGKLIGQCVVAAGVAAYLFIPAVSERLQIGEEWFAPPVIKQQTLHPATDAETAPKVATYQLTLADYAARLYVPFFKNPLILFGGAAAMLGALFVFLVVVGASNAVNLTDGLDGLAAGCLILVASCLALVAFVTNNLETARYLNILYVEESGEIAIYLSAFAGACLGFLWYNGHPAEVFMGDVGSLALGGILGVSVVLLKRELLLALIGGIFVAETVSVILQITSYRYNNRRRIFLCTPLHHHFEYLGWPESKVVLRFWIVGLLFAIIGLLSLKFQ